MKKGKTSKKRKSGFDQQINRLKPQDKGPETKIIDNLWSMHPITAFGASEIDMQPLGIVAKGTGSNQRIGDRVKYDKMDFRINLAPGDLGSAEEVLGICVFRLLVLYDRQPDVIRSGSAPNVYLGHQGNEEWEPFPDGFPNPATLERYTYVYDKKLLLGIDNGALGVMANKRQYVTSFINRQTKSWEFTLDFSDQDFYTKYEAVEYTLDNPLHFTRPTTGVFYVMLATVAGEWGDGIDIYKMIVQCRTYYHDVVN